MAALALLWVVTILEALLMAVAGSSKFTNADLWVGLFVGWGYPDWFSFVIGALEAGLAILLLFPTAASYAAGALAVIMLGALVTVIVHGSDLGVAGPIIHLSLLTIVGVARWGRRWQRAGRPS